jgi:hypothetical protein
MTRGEAERVGVGEVRRWECGGSGRGSGEHASAIEGVSFRPLRPTEGIFGKFGNGSTWLKPTRFWIDFPKTCYILG